jgi:hypothetical protein
MVRRDHLSFGMGMRMANRNCQTPNGKRKETKTSTMKIVDIKPTTVTVPLEAPLRHANGCHWGRFVHTIVES